jgi:Sap, sulfolipid-1-addressing protein
MNIIRGIPMGTELLYYLSGLALLDTLSPTIIGVTLLLILNGQRNITSKLFAYLLTIAVLYFALGIALMLGFTYILDAFSTFLQHTIISRTLFSIGVILFVASFFVPANKKRTFPVPKTESILSIILIGITTFLIEAGTAFPYFAAIGLMTTNGLLFYQWLPALAAYTIIMILPAGLIFFGYRVLGRWFHRTLIILSNKLSEHSNSTLSWVLCIVGLILILNTV